jgi:HEAT repeat protein
MNAAIALARLRADAKPAVPNLIKAIKDKSNKNNLRVFGHTIQEVSALALGRASAGSTDAVGPLAEALDAATTDSERQAMARALGEIGPDARQALKQLRAVKTDQNPDLKAAVESALARIEGKAVLE